MSIGASVSVSCVVAKTSTRLPSVSNRAISGASSPLAEGDECVDEGARLSVVTVDAIAVETGDIGVAVGAEDEARRGGQPVARLDEDADEGSVAKVVLQHGVGCNGCNKERVAWGEGERVGRGQPAQPRGDERRADALGVVAGDVAGQPAADEQVVCAGMLGGNSEGGEKDYSTAGAHRHGWLLLFPPRRRHHPTSRCPADPDDGLSNACGLGRCAASGGLSACESRRRARQARLLPRAGVP